MVKLPIALIRAMEQLLGIYKSGRRSLIDCPLCIAVDHSCSKCCWTIFGYTTDSMIAPCEVWLRVHLKMHNIPCKIMTIATLKQYPGLYGSIITARIGMLERWLASSEPEDKIS